MKKIKIALLWHFHQPYYKKEDKFILPWVRLHGVKDYKDLVELFMEFPKIKQTINIVPSMWIQIRDYINNVTQDEIQILSKKDYKEFSENDKKEFIRMFFLCNEQNMIRPYLSYSILFDKSKNNTFDSFTPQEILDIQVWYNLTWIGQFSRKNPFIDRLFQKGNNFTEAERNIILDYHKEILSLIKPRLQTLESSGNLEISISPFYHPILPLLCNSDSTLESMPEAELPNTNFNFPEDATAQINNALNFYKTTFNKVDSNEVIGMWPSEGSLSNETLGIMIDNNINWAASDELVLSNSFKENYKSYFKYFPIKYKSKDHNNDITLFFRDHSLSDAIGFEYSNWNADDAANNFISRILNIKNNLIHELPPECLDYAVIPIILDGENCWEFYPENGIHFLRSLFNKIENSTEIETVLFKDVYHKFYSKIPDLFNLQAGSWINGNFNIWSGHRDHRIAWSILAETRKLVQEKSQEISQEIYSEVMNYIYISEGSDWFWWYGDSHWAENKYDFDELFRYNLTKIYNLLNIQIPDVLLTPINKQLEDKKTTNPLNKISFNEFNSIKFDEWYNSEIWKNAGYINLSAKMSSMHKVGDILKSIYYGNDDRNNLYVKLELSELINNSTSINITLNFADKEIVIFINKNEINIKSASNLKFIYFTTNNGICFALNLKELMKINEIILHISTNNQDIKNNYTDIPLTIL